MKYSNLLTFILYIFNSFLIYFFNSQEIERACSFEDLGKIISTCKDSKRDVYFYWRNKCDQKSRNSTSLSLPESFVYNGCGDCKENEFLDYSIENKDLFCNKCPFYSYSLGSKLEIDGLKKDWNKKSLESFSNFCLVVDEYDDNLEKNKDCSKFQVNKDNDYIISSETNRTDIVLFSNLILNVNLAKKGKMKFTYQKDTKIIDYNYNGVFKLYSNYFNILVDYGLDNQWKDYSFELEAGSYTFLWVYSKQIFESYPETKNFKLKIRSIEIEGMDNTPTECVKCDKNSTTTRCKQCPENTYFDESKITCVNCPENTYSERNAIGISSCKSKRQCMMQDADYFEQNYFYIQKDNQNILESVFKLNPLSDCDKSKASDLNNQMKNYPNLLSKSESGFCKQGLCNKNYNNTNDNKYICAPCEDNKFTNQELGVNVGECKEGYTDKIHYIFSKFYQNYTKICRCSQERPIDKRYEEVTLFTFNGTLITGSNLPEYVISDLSSNFEVVEETGELFIDYLLERNIPDNTKESLYLTLNGEIIDFLNMTQPFDLNKTTSFRHPLKKGSYEFNLIYNRDNLKDPNSNRNLIKIYEISVKNTRHGGGFKCNPCKNGLRTPNCESCKAGEEEKNGLCVSCSEGHYKKDKEDKCKKCPPFTKSSSNKINCEPKNILEVKEYSYRFLMGGLNLIQSNECQGETKLCYDSFIGPIDNVKEREFFYISYSKRDEIDISDFSYSTNKNKKPEGHIFYLKNSNANNKDKQNFDKHENLKTLLNIGNYIEYIKALPLMTNKEYKFGKTDGYYLKYSQGDTCSSDPKKNYTSYIFVICDKFSNQNYPIYKMKSADNCTFYFEWKNKYGCKSCNLDETEKHYGVCRDGKRNVLYIERPYCLIESAEKFKSNELISQSNLVDLEKNIPFEELFYSKTSSNTYWAEENKNVEFYLQKFLSSFEMDDMSYYKDRKFYMEEKPINFFDFFKFGNKTNKNETNENYQVTYIETNNLETTCVIYEDFDNMVYIIIIVVPICYLTLIIYLIFVYCRYRKIYSQYSRLRDERETESHNSNNDRDQNRIELGNISQSENK